MIHGPAQCQSSICETLDRTIIVTLYGRRFNSDIMATAGSAPKRGRPAGATFHIGEIGAAARSPWFKRSISSSSERTRAEILDKWAA